MTTVLPSRAGDRVTQEVAYLQVPPEEVSRWLADGLGAGWRVRGAGWTSVDDAVRELEPAPILDRYAVIPVAGWSAILNNGPLGTDVGMLPSQSARELGGLGIRAVCVDDDAPGYPARILEVFGPEGDGPLKAIRSIAAANDGGTWVFETSGNELPFERPEHYRRRLKRERLTCELLYEYLRALAVPVGVEPEWAHAVVVETGVYG